MPSIPPTTNSPSSFCPLSFFVESAKGYAIYVQGSFVLKLFVAHTLFVVYIRLLVFFFFYIAECGCESVVRLLLVCIITREFSLLSRRCCLDFKAEQRSFNVMNTFFNALDAVLEHGRQNFCQPLKEGRMLPMCMVTLTVSIENVSYKTTDIHSFFRWEGRTSQAYSRPH